MCFWERIRAFLLDGILRGEHEKRIGQKMVRAADGDLALLHGFEHSGLGLGRRAVDFVGENHVRENRAFKKSELAVIRGGVLINDFCAGDVAGHQVRGELDALEGKVQGLRESRDEERFCETRHADEQSVTTSEDCD